MKYIIIKVNNPALDCARYYPIIFPENLVHKRVAGHMRYLIDFDNREGNAEIYSAGFCYIHGEEVRVREHGSESLRIESDNEQAITDHRILNLPDCMQGILP